MTTIVISGANRGIGLEFARQYAADGARVIAGCRDPEAATELSGLTGDVTILPLDVADDASVAAFSSAAGDAAVDILIANAGVWGGQREQQFGTLDFDNWARVLSVNTLGPMRLAQAFADRVRAAPAGRMIALTSGMSSTAETEGGHLAYRSSKAALNNAWRNLAIALKPSGVACTVIDPGWVKTDMGGDAARLTPEQSVTGMRAVIAGLTPATSGRFLRWDGNETGW